jgi:tetratricopeptide (TPR) repeat protein
MGKSHCAAHFSRLARARGARILLGVCQSTTRNAPYAPWRQILPALLGVAGAPEEEALARLGAFAGSRDPSWALRFPVLGDILGLRIPENPTTAALDMELRQKTLFSLVADVVRREAQEQPLVLILDDAHWMDEASLALTLTLARRAAGGAPVMILLLHRPPHGGDAPVLAQLAELPHYLGVSLDGMSEEDGSALVRRVLGGPAAPLLLTVASRLTRGNPFFIGEMLVTMRESGQITRDEISGWRLSDTLVGVLQMANVVTQTEGRWQLRPDADMSAVKLGIPDSVHGLILSRLDHLPEAQKVTLKVGSVIGATIDLDLLAAAHPEGRSPAELEEDLGSMAREGWLRREGTASRVYAFCHHTTQEVAYETLLFSQRRGLHAAVAGALVERRPEAVPEVAHHAMLGEVWPLALRYTLLAGDRARQLFANQQSLDYFQKASHCAASMPEEDTSEPRKRIHLALGELLVSTGQGEAALPHLETGLSLARSQNDRESEARCCRWFGRLHEGRGEYPQALEWLDAGAKALDGRPSTEGAELSLVAGLINFRQGRYPEALDSCERGVRLGEALNDGSICARAYNLTGIIELRRDGAVAIERFRQSLGRYEQLGNLYGQATSHNLIANGYFALCDWDAADAEYRRAQDLFTQIGDTYNRVLVGSNLGGVALKQERFDESLAHYEEALRLLERMGGSLFVSGGIHLNMGNVLILKGSYELALAELEVARDYLDRAKVREFLPELYGLFAEAAWRIGDLDAAERHGRQSVELARELSMPREEGHNLRILGEIARARGEEGPAEESFERSIALLDEAGDEHESARTKLALARLRMDRGKSVPILPVLAQCEAVLERMGAPGELREVRDLRRQLEEAGRA